MTFGSGMHHCIGAPLARQELNLGFRTLLERVKNCRLDTDKPPPEVEPSFVLRNLAHLQLRNSGHSGNRHGATVSLLCTETRAG